MVRSIVQSHRRTWKDREFIWSVGLGLVLLGHLHYSIDVFAAFFITYSIFHLAKRIFAEDYDLLREA